MSASTLSSSNLFRDPAGDFHSRRLLHSNLPLNRFPNNSSLLNTNNSTESYIREGDFDANVVVVLSVLLCALICSLGLNSIIRCALRCSNLINNEPGSNPPARATPPNTGIKRKALKTFPTINYSAGLQVSGSDTECVICLSDFVNGDCVRILPKCNHGFHVRCIDKWLASHSSCPTCRHCLIDTCQKIVGCSQASSTQPTVPETILRIAPLEPEALVRNYRGLS